ncbi:MAG: response regulator transcription factor [Chitinophagaceae bacterium]|nr:response regulator transcription factor [Chitinophagaceae bacterium]
MNYTIAIAEDNKAYLNSFLHKIAECKHLQLLFTAVNGRICLEQLKGLPYDKMPQVIFMDLEMPEMDGVETISIAKSLYPEIHFIVLTVLDDDEKVFEAIKAGASGYLLKHEPAAVLSEAIADVMENQGAPMSPGIARKALGMLSRSVVGSNEKPSNASNLPKAITEREEEILKHMVAGWDAKRIASVLDISVYTVRNHVANIYQKLQVQSKAQVIQMAHRNKWF